MLNELATGERLTSKEQAVKLGAHGITGESAPEPEPEPELASESEPELEPTSESSESAAQPQATSGLEGIIAGAGITIDHLYGDASAILKKSKYRGLFDVVYIASTY